MKTENELIESLVWDNLNRAVNNPNEERAREFVRFYMSVVRCSSLTLDWEYVRDMLAERAANDIRRGWHGEVRSIAELCSLFRTIEFFKY